MMKMSLVEHSIALVISALALLVAFVSLYLSQLRGPSMKPIEPDESKRTIQITDSRYVNITGLPFTIAVSIVNGGGTAGIVANPRVSIALTDSLKQIATEQITIGHVSIKPSNESSSQTYGASSVPVYSIPPYSVSVFRLECSLALMEFRRFPPLQNFPKGCNLKEVHLSDFNSRKERMQALIAELHRTNTLGHLNVTIDCSEKTIPVIGPMGYKSRNFLRDAPLVYDNTLLKQLSENFQKLEFEKEYAVNTYLNFLNYIQQQSTPIIRMLETLDETSAVSFPTEHTDERHILACQILSIKDESFGQSLAELDRYIQTYKDILRILREKKPYGLTENDKMNIKRLKEALENALSQSLNLRAVIVEEFR
jgi:hypothetical protein